MQVVHKYKVAPDGFNHGMFKIPMPEHAEIVHVDIIDGHLCFWAEITKENKMEDKPFRVFMTGQDVTDGDESEWLIYHLRTVVNHDTGVVMHVYEYV
jgi:hypothetical protein